MKLRESKWGVRIISENEDGKVMNNYVEIKGNILQVSRFVNTFSPKNGYDVVKVDIARLQELV